MSAKELLESFVGYAGALLNNASPPRRIEFRSFLGASDRLNHAIQIGSKEPVSTPCWWAEIYIDDVCIARASYIGTDEEEECCRALLATVFNAGLFSLDKITRELQSKSIIP